MDMMVVGVVTSRCEIGAIGWSNHMGCNPNRGGSRNELTG